MGCYTWFYRPMTEKEFETMKESAYYHASVASQFDVTLGYITESERQWFLRGMKKSIEMNVPSVYNECYWYELGYGWDKKHNKGFKTSRCIENKMYMEVFEFDGECRWIRTYPRKVIHSYKQYKKYLRNKWYNIPASEKERLKRFFEQYPGGVIVFG